MCKLQWVGDMSKVKNTSWRFWEIFKQILKWVAWSVLPIFWSLSIYAFELRNDQNISLWFSGATTLNYLTESFQSQLCNDSEKVVYFDNQSILAKFEGEGYIKESLKIDNQEITETTKVQSGKCVNFSGKIDQIEDLNLKTTCIYNDTVNSYLPCPNRHGNNRLTGATQGTWFSIIWIDASKIDDLISFDFITMDWFLPTQSSGNIQGEGVVNISKICSNKRNRVVLYFNDLKFTRESPEVIAIQNELARYYISKGIIENINDVLIWNMADNLLNGIWGNDCGMLIKSTIGDCRSMKDKNDQENWCNVNSHSFTTALEEYKKNKAVPLFSKQMAKNVDFVIIIFTNEK